MDGMQKVIKNWVKHRAYRYRIKRDINLLLMQKASARLYFKHDSCMEDLIRYGMSMQRINPMDVFARQQQQALQAFNTNNRGALLGGVFG